MVEVVPKPPSPDPRVAALQVPEPVTPEEHHFEKLFRRWAEMGPGASYQALAAEAQVGILPLSRHALKFKWRERASAVTTAATEKAMADAAVNLAQVQTEQLQAVHELRRKALLALKSLVIDKPADAIKALELSIKLERQVLGMDEEKSKNKLEDVLTERLRQLTGLSGAPEKQVEARVVPSGDDYKLDEVQAEPPTMDELEKSEKANGDL